MRRRAFAAFPLFALTLLLVAHAGAVVPDTQLRVTATAGETESHELTGASIATADADYSSYSPEGDGYAVTAHALAGGGGGSPEDPPVADCSAARCRSA